MISQRGLKFAFTRSLPVATGRHGSIALDVAFPRAESGEFLALDLGGTNFRVIFTELREGKIRREEVKYYNVPEEVRLGPGERLFDFLADCIKDFIEKERLTGEKLTLG